MDLLSTFICVTPLADLAWRLFSKISFLGKLGFTCLIVFYFQEEKKTYTVSFVSNKRNAMRLPLNHLLKKYTDESSFLFVKKINLRCIFSFKDLQYESLGSKNKRMLNTTLVLLPRYWNFWAERNSVLQIKRALEKRADNKLNTNLTIQVVLTT